MKHTSTIYRLTCLAFCFMAILFASCKKGKTFSPGGNDEIHIETVDTVQVKASTYLLDSLPTTNTGGILVGQIDDKDFGILKASSYFRIVPPAAGVPTIPKGATFDSFNLVLKYNKSTSGDTSVQQNYTVQRLTEEMILRKVPGPTEGEQIPLYVKAEALYSTTTFKHEMVPIGNLALQVKPLSGDSIIIPLNEALGREFLDLMNKKDSRFISEAEFIKYFKGIVLKTKTGNSINGFKADAVKMNVNYNYVNSEGFTKKDQVVFSAKSVDYQFNHFDTDRSQTKLKTLSNTNKEVSAALTGQMLFIQGGTGLVTKLQFPTLVNFLNESKKVVNKIELLIETKPTYYSVFNAPPKMILFIANSANVPKSILPNNYKEGNQTADFEPGNDIGSTGKYRFILTQYATELKKGTYKNTSLFLSIPTEQLLNSVSRAQLYTNETKPSIKLIITYTKY
ncbi:hypothetical protein HDF26_000676 [Pedobacter cryoconitis]|uniref:DUF4270 family protein n=1 Tax=Pedobacter cryoconitis TaxID=188932 RepID=A0A7W9E1Y3_9SPHI|nr:DUF4270 family protein [Pedobacter cryoconitis]MBB5638739.1 hypothetical protein [Pedobacter cryoconitis]MBB6270249.1 hypothetical protein [Pedobacter cryoconitis]